MESERQKLKRLPEESEKNLRFENEEAENVEEKRGIFFKCWFFLLTTKGDWFYSIFYIYLK